ncbi:MAG TPA: hypothetical protein VGQ15_03105 [Gaiellaceae bacterium]|jgi:hypothetical protein|nr:hypothetical protein [Gaiellaceae bacterium]
MHETSVGRRDYALLGGILAVALFLASFIVVYGVGTVPDRNDASPADFAQYFQQEDGSIWLGSLLMGLAAVAFLFYVGALRSVLSGSRLSGTLLAGGIGTAVLILCNIAPPLSGAVLVSDRDSPIDPSTATTLMFLGDGFFIAAFYAAAVFVGAAGLAVLRTGVLPRWLGWVSLVLALVMMIPWFGFLGFIFLFPVWIVGTTLWLWSRPAMAAAPAV